MKRGSVPLFAGGIFALVGTVFLIISVAFTATTLSFLGGAERTEGVVVDHSLRTSTDRDGNSRSAYYPVVEFTAPDGQTVSFESSTGSNPPSNDVGDQVEVAYDPDDPSDARLTSFVSLYLLPLIFGGIGILFTPIGVVLLVIGIGKRNARNKILQHGAEVWAEIAEVTVDFNVRFNNRHPYVVHATWHDDTTGRTYHSSSDYLRYDPGPNLRGQSQVLVRYNPENPDENVMVMPERHSRPA
jgi:hypothetical protein